jgi:hypothetical protein
MKRNKTALFEFGEALRKASNAAYDLNRDLISLAKRDPDKASELEQVCIAGLRRQVSEGESAA